MATRLTEFPWDLAMLPFVAFEDKAMLPVCPGVYFVMTGDVVLYIGGTVDLHRRFRYHQYIMQCTASGADTIRWMPFGVKKEASAIILGYEAQAVAHYHPTLNERQPHKARSQAFRDEERVPLRLKSERVNPWVAQEYRVAVFVEERLHRKPLWHAYTRNYYSDTWEGLCIHTVFAAGHQAAKRKAIQECQAHRFAKPTELAPVLAAKEETAGV